MEHFVNDTYTHTDLSRHKNPVIAKLSVMVLTADLKFPIWQTTFHVGGNRQNSTWK
jgi:hypothetical protein